MNVNSDAVLNTVIQNTRESIPFILASLYLDPEAENLQIHDINQDIQEATSDYLVNILTPNTNLLDTNDYIINYIKKFLQPHHYYPKPLTISISQFYSPTTQYHLTPYLRAESRATPYATVTESTPNTSSPGTPLSNSTEYPSYFILTHKPYQLR